MHRFIIGFLGAAIVLPIVIVVLGGITRLLLAMNDQAGAVILDRIGLVVAVVWVVDLIMLLIVQAMGSLLTVPPRKE